MDTMGPNIVQANLPDRFPLHKILELAVDLLDTMHYLHEKGMSEIGTIRPDNIFLSKNSDHLVLRDFGSFTIARSLRQQVIYNCPEPQHSEACDVFNFGLTLKAMLGRHPMAILSAEYASRRHDISFPTAASILSHDDYNKFEQELGGYAIYNRTLPAEFEPYPEPLKTLIVLCMHISPEKRPVHVDIRNTLKLLIDPAFVPEVHSTNANVEDSIDGVEINFDFNTLDIGLLAGFLENDHTMGPVFHTTVPGRDIFAYKSANFASPLQEHEALYPNATLITPLENLVIKEKLKWIGNAKSTGLLTTHWILYEVVDGMREEIVINNNKVQRQPQSVEFPENLVEVFKPDAQDMTSQSQNSQAKTKKGFLKPFKKLIRCFKPKK